MPQRQSHERGIALQLTLLVLFTSMLFGCRAPDSEVRIENGVLDLTRTGWPAEGFLELQGDWGFFWNAFIRGDADDYKIPKAEEWMEVPGYWSPHKRGTGIYSLRIRLPDDAPAILGLKLTNVLESYTLYIGGEPVYSSGRPAPRARDAEPMSRAALVPTTHNGESLVIQLQVSSWSDIYGGLNRPIYFGDFESLKAFRERRLALNAILFGAVLVLGLYHLGVFFFHKERSRYSFLFLGLICLLIALFTGCKDELLLKTIYPGFSAAARSAINYSALTLSIPLFFCYLYFIMDDLFHRWVFRTTLVLSLSFWLFIILTEPALYTPLLIPLELYNLAVTIYTFTILGLRRIKGDRLTTGFIAGYIILVAGEIAGVLDNAGLVPPLTPHIVFFIFLIYQGLLQADFTALAYNNISNLNRAYQAMEQENQKFYDLSYRDPLTSLSNRRHLDHLMEKLWERNRLTETAVSMMVIDIDNFKRYNDSYGHSRGDECLIEVAQTLEKSLSRRGDFVARYGGEEFVAVANCSSSELPPLAKRLARAVEDLGIEHVFSDCAPVVTISIGCASQVPQQGSRWLALFNRADKALYAAKKAGRNRVFTAGEMINRD